MKTLGIDLGTNSLGWAILDDERPAAKAVQDAGVVIFEEGIKRDKGNDSLETPAAERRKHRMARRLKFRRRMRKLKILEILIANGMCPLTTDELKRWKQTDSFPVNNQAFLDWLKSTREDNPYGDRSAAATQKVAPDVLGRAIYHLAQRRGFRSSRKDARNEQDEHQSKRQDERGKVKNSIAELTASLEKKRCTLGQHFFDLYQKGEKVRGCYTGRKEHYEKEFDAIAKAQKMDEALAERIRRVLFFQRPLRPQTHLIGKCPLEKKHSRCRIGHPAFEAFRMWSFINTIRIVAVDGERIPLTAEQRTKVAKAFYKSARYVHFADLVKALKLPKETQFNYPPKKTVATCSVTHQLDKIFGGDCMAWSRPFRTPDGRTVTYTYQTVFDAVMFFEDDEKLSGFAKTKLGLDDETTAEFTRVVCPEGYAQYSLAAIQRINPFLMKGIELSQAVFLAKIPEVMGAGTFTAHEAEIIADVLERNEDYRKNLRDHARDSKIGVVSLQTRLWQYMQTKWAFSEEQFQRLYFRDSHADASYADVAPGDVLPPVNLGMLRNPLVQRTLTVLRKHVNYLRRTGRIDADTRIHLELARSVNDRNTRMAYAIWQKQREEQRQEARARLAEMDCPNPSDTDILRYILWQEQGLKCLYTGVAINQRDLLSAAFDVEHTIPRCRSGNNSQANLTLCSHAYNCQRKKGRIPAECDNFDEIQVRLKPWQDKVADLEAVYLNQQKIARNTPADNLEARARNRQKALVTRFELNYWRDKVAAFAQDAERLTEGFLNRQLVDTGIISRHAIALLRTVYRRTYPVNGTAVAWARHGWGVQKITEKKERSSHLHHAIDAMVIAGLDRNRFNSICAYCKDDGEKDYEAIFPEKFHPFPDFAQAVFNTGESILVKHLPRHVEMKQTTRCAVRLAKAHHLQDGRTLSKVAARGDTVRGQLHKDSFYGCIRNPETGGQKAFVIRKLLTAESFAVLSDLDKIVDPAIRQIVQDEVQRRIADGASFKKAMDEGGFKMPSGVPIKKVRIRAETVSDPLRLQSHVFASRHDYKNPYYAVSAEGSNFRLALFKREVRGKIKYEFMADSLLDWARRSTEAEEPHRRTDLGEFVGYVQPGRMALVYENSPEELNILPTREMINRLYKVVKFDSQGGRITLIHHTEARSSKDLAVYLKMVGKNPMGESSPNIDSPHEMLRVSPSVYMAHMLFEGIHFDMDLAGNISFRSLIC